MSEARVLLYDVENSPNLGYCWGKWEQNIIQFDTEWHLLSVAYRWLGEKKIHHRSLPDWPKEYKKDPADDLRLTEHIHDLFSAADILVAHNGNAFDQRKSQARMLVHGLLPPAPYRQIDTLQIARKYFALNSNTLKDLAITLGLDEVKSDPGGFATWLGCMNQDPAAWARLVKYNVQDVRVLTEVFIRLRPWADNLPSIAQLEGDLDSCPKCGEDALTRQGFKRTKVSTFQQWQCSACGGWCRSRLAEKIDKPSIVN